jgi:S1-C subfamily serine protease
VGGEAVAAPLVAHDERNDLALLRLRAPAEAAATFRDGRGLRQGDDVVVTGFALDDGSSDFHLTTGVVSALSGARNDNSLLEVSAALRTGHAGGPVFDGAGHVVGIVAAGEARGTALKAAAARNFLDAHNVEYDSAASTAELKPADIGDLAKKIVVLVECAR